MPELGRGAGASTGCAGGAGPEHGRRRHVRVIGGAGGPVGAEAGMLVTARDQQKNRPTRQESRETTARD